MRRRRVCPGISVRARRLFQSRHRAVEGAASGGGGAYFVGFQGAPLTGL
jgi:hypothetical protein